MGALTSVFILVGVAYFTFMKYGILSGYEDTVINTKELENFYKGS